MKRRTLTVALAGMLALLGAVAVLAYTRQANVRAVDGMKAETVLAASRPIRVGTSLGTAESEHLLTSEKVPVASLSTPPVSSVTSANTHLVVSANVATGQVLLQNMVTTSVASAVSAAITIPKGMLAVTVQLCASEAIANYLTAGSEVNVFGTYPTNSKVNIVRSCNVTHTAVMQGASNTITAQVLTDIKVLSVTHALPNNLNSTTGLGSVVESPVSESLSLNTVAVTFLVTPAQAVILIEADQVYLPYLALLPPAR